MISKIATKAWKKAMKRIFEEGYEFVDTNGRLCRELLNLRLTVENPEIQTQEPIEILNNLHNWTYPNLSEIREIILSKKSSLDYLYSYGQRLFNASHAIDQIDNYVVPLLKTSENTRRAVASLWEPEHDSNTNSKEVPGLVYIDFKLRDGRLNMTAVIRSCDLFFGWPANIYQLFCLQDYVCKKLGCKFGALTTFLTSAHIFEYQFEYIKRILE